MTAKGNKTKKAVADEQRGHFGRRVRDLERRLFSKLNPLNFQRVMDGLQLLIENKRVTVRRLLDPEKLCRQGQRAVRVKYHSRSTADERPRYFQVKNLQDALNLLQEELCTYSEEVVWFSGVYNLEEDPKVHPNALSLDLLYHAYCSVPDPAQSLEFPTEPVELAQLLWQAFAPYLADAPYNYPQSAISIEPILTDGCERLRVTAWLEFKGEHGDEVVRYFASKAEGDVRQIKGEWVGLD